MIVDVAPSPIDPPRLDRRCRPRATTPLVNGVRIDAITPEEFVSSLRTFLSCGYSHVVHFCSAHPTVEARANPDYRRLLNTGALNVSDGVPVAVAARMMGLRTVRLAGTDGFHLAAGHGMPLGLRHYLFGSTPATLDAMQRRLEERYPGILIVGAESPPFRELSDDEVLASARRMQDAGAQAVWVGLGAPKQDVMAHRLRQVRAAPIILCVGAAFDFIAGTTGRAPAWMQRMGLEWLHRLASEPRRLWRRYLVGNPRFVAGVVRDLVRRWVRRES